jgi:hypothetical protein
MLVYQRVPFEEVLWNFFKTTSYLQDLFFTSWSPTSPAYSKHTLSIARHPLLCPVEYPHTEIGGSHAKLLHVFVQGNNHCLGASARDWVLCKDFWYFLGGSKKRLLIPIIRYKYRDNVSIIDRTLQFSWDYNRNRIGIQKGGLWITVAPRFRCSWNS